MSTNLRNRTEKYCPKCKKIVPTENFWNEKRRSDGKHPYCKPCGKLRYLERRERNKEWNRKYAREYYSINKTKLLARAKDYAKERLAFNKLQVKEYKLLHPCIDCGETDPIVLQFHHIDNKKYTIAHIMSTKSWNIIEKEIKKCIVLCANCHLKRHNKEGY